MQEAVYPIAVAKETGDCIHIGFPLADGKHVGFCFLVVHLEMLNMQD